MQSIKTIAIAAAILLAVFPASSYAQSGSCRDIIPSDGARRTINLEEANSLSVVDYSVARSALSNTKNDQYRVNIVGKGSGSSSRARAKAEVIENTFYYNLTHDRYINSRIVEGDRIIIDAWRNCMNSRGGISIDLSSPDRRLITATVSWIKPRFSTVDRVRLKRQIFFSNADVIENTCGDVGAEIDERGCTIIFSRDNGKEESIVFISTDQGDETAYLPPNYTIYFKEYPYSSRTYPLTKRVRFPAGGGDTIPIAYKIDLPRVLIDRGFAFSSERTSIVVDDSTFMQGGHRGSCDVSMAPVTTPRSITGTILIWSNKAYPAFCDITPNVDVMVAVIDDDRAPSLE